MEKSKSLQLHNRQLLEPWKKVGSNYSGCHDGIPSLWLPEKLKKGLKGHSSKALDARFLNVKACLDARSL